MFKNKKRDTRLITIEDATFAWLDAARLPANRKSYYRNLLTRRMRNGKRVLDHFGYFPMGCINYGTVLSQLKYLNVLYGQEINNLGDKLAPIYNKIRKYYINNKSEINSVA